MKKTFKEQGKVTEDKKVRELLLFHATVFNNFHFSQEMTFNSRNEIKSNTGKTIIYKQTISLAF